jgi:hypothetical protein
MCTCVQNVPMQAFRTKDLSTGRASDVVIQIWRKLLYGNREQVTSWLLIQFMEQSLLGKLTVAQVIKPKGALPCSQEPATGVQSSLHPTPCVPKIHCNIIPICTWSSKWSPPFRFSNQDFERMSHIHMPSKCPVRLILRYLIALVIVSEEYRL